MVQLVNVDLVCFVSLDVRRRFEHIRRFGTVGGGTKPIDPNAVSALLLTSRHR